MSHDVVIIYSHLGLTTPIKVMHLNGKWRVEHENGWFAEHEEQLEALKLMRGMAELDLMRKRMEEPCAA